MRMTPIGLWIEPVTKRYPADDGAEIEKTRSHRRDAEDVSRVQHSHDQRSQRHEQNERKHDPREQHGELRFFNRETGRKNIDQDRCENYAEQRNRAHENEGEGCHFARQVPRRLVAFRCNPARERSHKRGGERAFGKEIAQHIGRAKRGQERVHVAARAEHRREDNFPNQPKNTATKNRDPDNAGRARADPLICRRSHRRTKNRVSELTKGKTSCATPRSPGSSLKIAPLRYY